MKKILLTGLTALLVAGLVAPATGRVVTARQDELAIASWLAPTAHPMRWKLFAVAVWGQETAGGDLKRTLYLLRGTCTRSATGEERCEGNALQQSSLASGFTMADDASSAQLDVARRGVRYNVRWRGQGHDLGHWFESCYSKQEEPASEGHGAGFLQEADVEGRAFGRLVSMADAGEGVLFRGVTATRCGSSMTERGGGGERFTWPGTDRAFSISR